MDTNSRPGKFWAYVAFFAGLGLFLSGTLSCFAFFALPFITRGNDIFSRQLGQMAAIFLGLVGGTLALYHGAARIFNRRSGPMRLPPVYFFWIVFALAVGVGNLLLNWGISVEFLFPLMFLLGAALPTLSVLAWSLRRLGWPITWRQGSLALVAGSTLAIFVALILESSLSLVEYLLLPPLRLSEGIPGDLLTRLFFSPALIILFILTAIQAPIPEEFSKGLSAILFGRKRITNERQAFAIGLVCGAGFAILENMLYEGLYAMQGGWSWGGVTLLRGLGAVLHPIGAALVTAGWFRARERGWGELLKAYAVAVGLHTLWNGGFTALVYLTGLEHYSNSAVLSLYGTPVKITLIVFLALLGLALWGLLRVLVTELARGVMPDLSPIIVSRRSLAVWALASTFFIVPLGATLGPGWAPVQEVILAGLPTPTPIPARTQTPTRRPTSTPAPSRTPTPNASSVTATAIAAQATVTAIAERPVYAEETFDSNERKWPTGPYDSEYWEGSRSVENGKYRWEARAKKGFVGRASPGSANYFSMDHYLTLEGRQTKSSKGSAWGVYLRYRNGDYYLFTISDDQSYKFTIMYRSQWITIIPSTRTPAIRPGEVNRISVISMGTHFAFLINDRYVAEAEDDRIGTGYFGIVIDMNSGNQEAFEFDNLQVRSLW